MKTLWKEFDRLTESCYMSTLDENCKEWDEAYDVFWAIIRKGRETEPMFASEIIDLDDATDFAYGVRDWIEDYLDELDVQEEHQKLFEICQELLKEFKWEKEYSGDIKFRMASAMAAEGEKEECLQFCKKWYEEEKSPTSATALIYAYMSLKDLNAAEEIVQRFILPETICTEENDILFIAASDLYQVSNKTAEYEKVLKELQKYEQGMLADLEDMDSDISFELPFD